MASKALYAWQQNVCILKLVGELRFTDCPSIDKFIQTVCKQETTQIVLDLSETTLLDSTALGMLAQVAIRARNKQKDPPTLLIDNDDLKVLLQSVCFDRVFSIIKIADSEKGFQFESLETINSNEEVLATQVLTSHQNLMQLSYGNHLNFHDVLDAMDQQLVN